MRKISLLGIMMVSLLLIGCGKNAVSNENEPVKQESASFDKIGCMKGCEMISDKNLSKDEMLKNCSSLCEAGNAITTNNGDGCKKADGVVKDSCYSSIAYETENVELCKKITDKLMKYACYTSISEKTKDDSVCSDVDDSMWKDSCEAAAKIVNEEGK